MALICYHASHEQFTPSRLLALAGAAERAGFKGLHSSDHFHPWSARQGQSGFAFAWVGAAMQSTSLPMSLVCAPGQRYHPAIIAQAVATLAEMFPGRFSIEVGSGEALNECITGEGWPQKTVREERLLECVDVMRRLLRGELVNFDGHIKVENARLWTLPEVMPPILGAAVTARTAAWVAEWADGLLTTADKDLEEVREKVDAYRRAGGDMTHVHLQYSFSYARKRQDAIDGAWRQWRGHIAAQNWEDLRTPEDFDRLAKQASKEELLEETAMFTRIEDLLEQVRAMEAFGATRLILHNMNTCHEDFIEDFGKARAARRQV